MDIRLLYLLKGFGGIRHRKPFLFCWLMSIVGKIYAPKSHRSMSNKNNSGYYGQAKYISDVHRTLGRKVLMSDIDQLEYHYEDQRIVLDAIIDVKEGHVGELHMTSAIQAQKVLADQLGLPFFKCLCWLDPEKYEIPTYWVVPLNDPARAVFTATKQDWNGVYMSVYSFAKFQHYLRKMKADENEIGHLSKKVKRYELPQWVEKK
jgi:hypothetical protein